MKTPPTYIMSDPVVRQRLLQPKEKFLLIGGEQLLTMNVCEPRLSAQKDRRSQVEQRRDSNDDQVPRAGAFRDPSPDFARYFRTGLRAAYRIQPQHESSDPGVKSA